VADKPLSGGFAPSLAVRTGETGRVLSPGPTYLVGRDPECDIVVPDARVSWRHAVLRFEDGRWVLADNGSTNGTFTENRRADRIEIGGPCEIRLGHAADGPVLSCTAGDAGLLLTRTLRIGRAADNDVVVRDLDASRYHAEMRVVWGSYHIVDLGSHSGTFVNGRRVSTAPLFDGDVIGIGRASFQLVGQHLREFEVTGPSAARPAADEAAGPPSR
jgi:ABC transport system ATP-binding/permease protein